MLFEKLEQARKQHNVLSQCDTLGSYDFFSTIVSLDSLNKRHFENLEPLQQQLAASRASKGALDPAASKKLRKIFALAQHEYTHFIDCTSTIWGIKYLSLMASAYQSDDRLPGRTEESFFQAKRFSDLLRFIKLPSYFTSQEQGANTSLPWTFKESIGNRFDSFGQISPLPVLFTQFGNSSGQLIVRSPVSTLSILECSAMAQEVACNINLIMQLDEGVREVEFALYTKEILEYIYNRELTEYSVCAHLLANCQTNPDIGVTFKYCAIICRYVLNTPSIIYQRIAENADLLAIFGSNSEQYTLKIRKGLEFNEPGFLFYLICKLLPNDSLESDESMLNGLKVAFEVLGIDLNDLKSESKIEFSKHLTEITQSQIQDVINISNAGLNNFVKINWDSAFLPFDALDLPPALLGDSTSIKVFPGIDQGLINLDLDDLFENMFKGQSWVERFTEACA